MNISRQRFIEDFGIYSDFKKIDAVERAVRRPDGCLLLLTTFRHNRHEGLGNRWRYYLEGAVINLNKVSPPNIRDSKKYIRVYPGPKDVGLTGYSYLRSNERILLNKFMTQKWCLGDFYNGVVFCYK